MLDAMILRAGLDTDSLTCPQSVRVFDEIVLPSAAHRLTELSATAVWAMRVDNRRSRSDLPAAMHCLFKEHPANFHMSR